MARSVANLPGDTMESGIYFGASSLMICSAKPDGGTPTTARLQGCELHARQVARPHRAGRALVVADFVYGHVWRVRYVGGV